MTDPPGQRGWLRVLARAGISRILLGSLIGQGTVLAAAPLLTRLYTAADFGALAAFTAIASVLGGIATLSWDRAVVIPRSQQQARAVVILGLITAAVFSLLMLPVFYLAGPALDGVFGTSVFRAYWWLMSLTVLAVALFAVMSSWLVRAREYESLARRNAIQGIGQAISTVSLGAAGMGALGLVSGLAVGRLCGVGGAGGSLGLRSLTRVSGVRLVVAARRFRRFPLMGTGSRMLNQLGLQLPPLLVVALYGSVEAGLYALTLRVLASPVGIVVGAAGQYFEGKFAQRVQNRSGGLVSLIRSLSTRLLVISALPTLLVFAFGPGLFVWAFGPEWGRAGTFAQITIGYYAIQLAVSPVSRSLLVLERQGTQLGWDVTRLVATLLAVLIPVVLGEPLSVALIALSACLGVLYVMLYYLCARAARAVEQEWRGGD